MANKKNCTLSVLIIVSVAAFNILGNYWHTHYYHGSDSYTPSSLPLAYAMQGIHDKLYMTDYFSSKAGYSLPAMSISDKSVSNGADILASAIDEPVIDDSSLSLSYIDDEPQNHLKYVLDQTKSTNTSDIIEKYSFTTVPDSYFDDACFIGDSRTVGISEYSGIEKATFLCKNSLSIYDYDKPKITYEDVKMSIKDVLTQKQFAKIYLMVGINECGTGTPESFYEIYRNVIDDIRSLQPDALIYIQGNLFVTQRKSDEDTSITNENISARNNLISTIANQKDIFYIDINESSLCDKGALIPDYTWDQVHIKAQYYPIWKDFLLNHAIVPS